MVRLILVELVDLLGKPTVDEQTLPSGDRIGPDDGVRVGQVLSLIIRRSSVFADRDLLVLSLFDEEGRRMESGETFEELLIVRRESIVCLVSRTAIVRHSIRKRSASNGTGGKMYEYSRPQGITPHRRESPDLKCRIVRRLGLESNI